VINIKYLLIYYMKANCQKHIVKEPSYCYC